MSAMSANWPKTHSKTYQICIHLQAIKWHMRTDVHVIPLSSHWKAQVQWTRSFRRTHFHFVHFSVVCLFGCDAVFSIIQAKNDHSIQCIIIGKGKNQYKLTEYKVQSTNPYNIMQSQFCRYIFVIVWITSTEKNHLTDKCTAGVRKKLNKSSPSSIKLIFFFSFCL